MGVLRLWVLLVALCALGACPGSMILNDARSELSTPDGGGGPRDGKVNNKVDLPTTPGVPCLSGQCGPNLICMANVCLKMCNQPMAGCNDLVATCSPKEACMSASSFTDACYPASAALNDRCDLTQAIFCVQGTLCVKVDSKPGGRCLKLCKYGCPSGTHCVTTTNHCDVCLPN